MSVVLVHAGDKPKGHYDLAIEIDGLHCDACALNLVKKFRELDTISKSAIDIKNSTLLLTLKVAHDASVTWPKTKDIIKMVETKNGIDCHEYKVVLIKIVTSCRLLYKDGVHY
jgi:hypothetical protein